MNNLSMIITAYIRLDRFNTTAKKQLEQKRMQQIFFKKVTRKILNRFPHYKPINQTNFGATCLIMVLISFDQREHIPHPNCTRSQRRL